MKKSFKLCPGCLINGWNFEGYNAVEEDGKMYYFCHEHYQLRKKYEKDEKK